MGRALSLVLVLFLLLAAEATAGPAIDVGTVQVFFNSPAEAVPVNVTGTNLVTGFNLRAQLGDGMGPGAEPVFQSVSYAGSMWDTGPGYAGMGGPVAGAPQFAQASVAFSTTFNVPASGRVAMLYVNTTGFLGSATFPLMLSGSQIGVDSAFILTGGAALPASITNGSIQVVPGGYWTGASSTAWQLPANWSSNMAPGSDFTAAFDLPAPHQPALTQDESVKGIVFKTAGWTIGGSGHTLSVGTGGVSSSGTGANALEPALGFTDNAAIDVGLGNTLFAPLGDVGGHTITKTGLGTLVFGGAATGGPGALLDVEAGTVDLTAGASPVDLNGDACLSITVTDAVVNFGADQRLDTLDIGPGGKVAFTGAHVVVLNHLVMSGFDFGAMTITPEPTTLALVVLGGVIEFWRRRRR